MAKDPKRPGTYMGFRCQRKVKIPACVAIVAGLRIYLDYEKGEGDYLTVKEVEVGPRGKVVLNCITPDHKVEEGRGNYSGQMIISVDRLMDLDKMISTNPKWEDAPE
jgi:hypothetical protein